MGTNSHFCLNLPETWRETTVYTFEGPHDSGVQHNLVLVIDRDPTTLAGSAFTTGMDADNVQVFRHMLGLVTTRPTATATGTVNTPITTITAADLDFLATWVRGKIGGADNYTVHG